MRQTASRLRPSRPLTSSSEVNEEESRPGQAPVDEARAKPTPLQRPTDKGPLFIKTQRAGMQEVEAGRHVEVWVRGGDRIVGTITAVAPHGILLVRDDSGNEELYLAKDIDQIFAKKRD